MPALKVMRFTIMKSSIALLCMFFGITMGSVGITKDAPDSAAPLGEDSAGKSKLCGQYSLIAVFDHLDMNVEFSDISGAAPVSDYGSNLEQLKAVAEAYDLKSLGARVSGQVLFQMKTPAILHVDDNHFVALLPNKDSDGFTVFDRPYRLTVTDPEEITSQWKWEGNCLLIDDKPIVIPKLHSNASQVSGYWPRLSFLVVIFLLGLLLIWKEFLPSMKMQRTASKALFLLAIPFLVSTTEIAHAEKRTDSVNVTKTPRISIEKPLFDAGLLFTDVPFITHDFEVKNIGTGDLIITEVKSDCTCSVMSKEKSAIKPGETGVVTFKRKFTNNKFGSLDAKILVKTNDPETPNTILFVKGERRQEFKTTPARIQFGMQEMGTGKSILMRVLSGKDDIKLCVDKLSVSSPHLEVTAICTKNTPTPNRRNLYILKVTLLPTAPCGFLNEMIRIPCLNSSKKTLKVPVTVQVEGPIKCSLYAAQFGVITTTGLGKSKDVLLRCETGFKIGDVHCDQEWLEATYKEIDEKSKTLTIVIKPLKLPKGKIEGLITIDTNMKEMKQIRIPVLGFSL